MNNKELQKLEKISLECREEIIRISERGGCFIGASLSCMDVITYLYTKYLNINNKNINDKNRDYFILSKGHDVPALYAILSKLNFFNSNRLRNHCTVEDSIYWHPNTDIPGIEFHSGSLGHGLSIAMGIAYFHKMKKMDNKIVVMIGDGEMNEGSIWEGLLVAPAKELSNLTVVIDRNEFQANLKTEDLIPLEPIENKLNAFGWNVSRINGHCFDEIELAFNKKENNSKPNIIISNTVRGKGLPSIEKDATRWFVHFTKQEVNMLIDELHGRGTATLESEILLVR
jgi:transketolase